jgi:photosystem II stability/assembly factor-like uncharacterized protein
MKKIITTCLALLFSVTIALGQTGIGIPSLTAPENEAENRMPNVIFNWTAVIGATGYHVLLATDEDFNNIVLDTITNLSALQNQYLAFNTTHYWKVRTVIDGNFSEWSETRSFKTFEKIVLDKPNNGSNNNEATVQLKWRRNIGGTNNPLSGFTKFQIQVSKDFNFGYFNREFTSQENLHDIALFDESTGWVIGEAGALFEISDGEINPDNAFEGSSADLKDIAFLNDQHGYIAGSDGFVAEFANGNWSILEDETLEGVNFNSVYIADENTAWFAGDEGVIVILENGSFTKESLEIVLDNGNGNDTLRPDINALAFEGSLGFAVGSPANDTIPGFYKYDGTAWSLPFYNSPGISTDVINDLHIVSDTDVWACGENGTILNLNANILVELENDIEFEDHLFSVSHLNEHLLFTTVEGQILTFKPFTGEWETIPSTLTGNLLGSVVNGEHLVAVGEGGAVLTYDPTILPFENPSWDIFKTFKISTDDTLELANIYFKEIYAWRMRAVHDEDESSWSDVWLFSNKSQITLDKPANNSVQQNLSFDISWKSFKGSTEYEYQVHPNESFSNAVTFITPNLSATVPKLLFGQDYYWRVKGLNQRDTSDWSTAWKFTTPNAVNLIGPSDGLDSLELKPLLRWEQIKGITFYNIQHADNENFDNAISFLQETDDTQTAPSYRPFNNLNEDTQYFWRVRALTQQDTSDFSPVWSFTTRGPVGINELFNNQNVSIFPNPASENAVLNIGMVEPVTARMQLVDITGREVFSEELRLSAGMNSIEMDLKNYTKGVYFISISNDKNVFTTKLIVK